VGLVRFDVGTATAEQVESVLGPPELMTGGKDPLLLRYRAPDGRAVAFQFHDGVLVGAVAKSARRRALSVASPNPRTRRRVNG
jgi:hypothetical protein